MMLASGCDADSAGFLLVLASGFDAGSAEFSPGKLASTGDDGSAGGACFSKFLRCWLLVLMLFCRKFSVGDVCFCKFFLMMLASGFDAGSVGVVCWGCLFPQVFDNDDGFWC